MSSVNTVIYLHDNTGMDITCLYTSSCEFICEGIRDANLFFLTMLRQHSQYDSRLGFSFKVLVRVRDNVRFGLGLGLEFVLGLGLGLGFLVRVWVKVRVTVDFRVMVGVRIRVNLTQT